MGKKKTFEMKSWSPREAAEFAAAKRLALSRALGDGDLVRGMERLLVIERRAERRVPLPAPVPGPQVPKPHTVPDWGLQVPIGERDCSAQSQT